MKRASLQVSINTLVLLVLAMALLGVVVGAFLGLFNQSREQLLDSILLVDAGVKATSSDIMAGADALRIRRNADQIIAVSFYNTQHTSCEDTAQLIFSCPEIDAGMLYDAVSVAVPIGQEKTIPGLLRIHRSIPTREYICTLKVRCGVDDIVADQHAVFDIQ